MKSETLANVMVTCIEGGSNHWVDSIIPKTTPAPDADTPWYADPKSYGPKFELTLTDIDGFEHSITRETITKGLKELERVYPARVQRILEDDGSADAEDTDIFLQTVVLGSLVYG